MLCGGLTGKAEDNDALHLQSGRVFINDRAQPGTYSAVMTHFRFLYFYVPEKGCSLFPAASLITQCNPADLKTGR